MSRASRTNTLNNQVDHYIKASDKKTINQISDQENFCTTRHIDMRGHYPWVSYYQLQQPPRVETIIEIELCAVEDLYVKV